MYNLVFTVNKIVLYTLKYIKRMALMLRVFTRKEKKKEIKRKKN